MNTSPSPSDVAALRSSGPVADLTVRADDARPAGSPDRCFYCEAMIGAHHQPDCVVVGFRVIEAAEFGVLYPIASYPKGHHALFWFPNGEKGVGGYETARAYPDDDGVYRTGWTHGGPNSGTDFDFCEPPTMWTKLPESPA